MCLCALYGIIEQPPQIAMLLSVLTMHSKSTLTELINSCLRTVNMVAYEENKHEHTVNALVKVIKYPFTVLSPLRLDTFWIEITKTESL